MCVVSCCGVNPFEAQVSSSMTAPDECMVAAQMQGLCRGFNLECAPGAGAVGVPVEDRLVDRDTKAVSLGQHKITVFNLEGVSKDFIGKGKWIHDGLAAMAVAGGFKP